MSAEYLDPTAPVAGPRRTAPRPASLASKVATRLDIPKAKGTHRLERLGVRRGAPASRRAVVRRRTLTCARPAPDDRRQALVGSTDVLVEARADGGSYTPCRAHDGVFVEAHGFPTATMVSSAFVGTARAQTAARGAPDYRTVVVPPPIQRLTAGAVQALADEVADDVLRRSTA